MHLEGSCHCGAVRFSVEAQSPVPFMHCHCSICRKTAGSGGFGINLGAKSATLKVRGEKHLGRYHALLREPGKRAKRSPAVRHFCRECGSAALALRPALARAGASARLGDRHAAAEAEGGGGGGPGLRAGLGRRAFGQGPRPLPASGPRNRSRTGTAGTGS